MIRKTSFLTAAVLASAASVAQANVSENNGNFFVGYTDVKAYPGIGLSLERVYNSKSSYSGLFGFGWGSDYEVFLSPQADGSVVLHQNGGGGQATFSPPKPDEAALHETIQALVAARRKDGDLTPEKLEDYGQRLATDERFRHDEWERLRAAAGLQPRQVPPGTQLVTYKWGYEVLTRTDNGYEREAGGQVFLFGDDGKLRSIRDRNGHSITVEYDGSNHLKRLSDDLGHSIQLDVDGEGHLLRAITSEGKRARYRYRGSQLVYSRDIDGNEYTYGYDDRYNLIRIGYSDGTEMVMAYDPMERNEGVRLVRERDGSMTLYERRGSEDPGALEHGMTVEQRGPDGQVISHKSNDYVERVNSTGSGRYLYQHRSDVDGDKTSVTNDEEGRPLEIVRNGERTVFRYDEKGRVIYRDDAAGVQELTYNELGKVSHARIAKREGDKLVEQINATYRYDDRANLLEAETSEGRLLKLTYDEQGRIATVNERTGADPSSARELRFEYDESHWKPTHITVQGVGEISVSYNEDGEIEKVDSSGGREVSLQVTSVFQSLLTAIRPAGVEF